MHRLISSAMKFVLKISLAVLGMLATQNSVSQVFTDENMNLHIDENVYTPKEQQLVTWALFYKPYCDAFIPDYSIENNNAYMQWEQKYQPLIKVSSQVNIDVKRAKKEAPNQSPPSPIPEHFLETCSNMSKMFRGEEY